MTSRFQNPVMNDTEKDNQTHMEYAHPNGDGEAALHTPPNKDLEQPAGMYLHKDTPFERKLLRRIDWRLVPVLCESMPSAVTSNFVARVTNTTIAFMYACSLIDRTNLP